MARSLPWGAAAAPGVVEAPAVAVAADPAYGFAETSRRIVAYNGYTYYHLPKMLVARCAILAARMAFSSLPIRF